MKGIRIACLMLGLLAVCLPTVLQGRICQCDESCATTEITGVKCEACCQQEQCCTEKSEPAHNVCCCDVTPSSSLLNLTKVKEVQEQLFFIQEFEWDELIAPTAYGAGQHFEISKPPPLLAGIHTHTVLII